jgi:hypothetical protein
MVGGKQHVVMIPARLVNADPKAAFRLADDERRKLVALRDRGLAASPTPLGLPPLVDW